MVVLLLFLSYFSLMELSAFHILVEAALLAIFLISPQALFCLAHLLAHFKYSFFSSIFPGQLELLPLSLPKNKLLIGDGDRISNI